MTIYYHGAKRPFNRFSYAHVEKGTGASQEGAGFYLTSSKQDAAAYGSFILTVKLPDKMRLLSQTAKPKEGEIVKLIRKAPDVNDELLNWGDTPQRGISNYLKAISHESAFEAFQSVWYDFYRYTPEQYVKNMAEAGYDGAVIKKRGGVTHFVGFNPFRLKVVNIERTPSA